MKICISVSGRFHAFNLAHQFFKRGFLNQLITSYPKFEVAKYGIPSYLISSIVSNELIARSWNVLPPVLKDRVSPQLFLSERFDRLAEREIKQGSKIFVGWSSFSLMGIRKAKQLGMVTILERGSSHIAYQCDLLQEEYEIHGIKASAINPKIVEKELREYEQADYIEVPSSFAKGTFLERGFPSDKIICTPLGVNTANFKPIKKRDDVFRIIYCGSLTLQKGVLYLLRVFCELNLPCSELWLIGNVSNEIKPFLKKYWSSNILLKGNIPKSVLYKYYSQGSVFCLPSIQDGFGLVILEAMACGLPAICTEHTTGHDVVHDGVHGFVIPIRNLKILKEKILFMYENQDKCREMGMFARSHVEDHFTWDVYGDRVVNEYRKAVLLR